MLIDLANPRHGHIEQRVVEPALGIGVHVQDRGCEQALGRGGDAHVARLPTRGFADDDRPGVPRRCDIDTRAGRFRRADFLDPELWVVGGQSSLLLDDVERPEVQQELAYLADIGGPAALLHAPDIAVLLQRRLCAITLAQRHRGDGVDVLLEPRQHQRARRHVALEVAARGEPYGKGNHREPRDEEPRDAARAHGRASAATSCVSTGVVRRRCRRHSHTSSAMTAKTSGTKTMLRILSVVPSRSMFSLSPARTARSSLRMRTFWVWKCSISCSCSGVRMRVDLLSLFDWSAVSLVSVSRSCASSSCSLACSRSSAARRSRSTRSKGRWNVARPRTLMRSALPARLSSAFSTRSPLLAQACVTRWPKKFCSRTHMKSCSMSVSANTTRLIGFADCLSGICPAASVTPCGGPAGKALWTLPLTRAPIA